MRINQEQMPEILMWFSSGAMLAAAFYTAKLSNGASNVEVAALLIGTLVFLLLAMAFHQLPNRDVTEGFADGP